MCVCVFAASEGQPNLSIASNYVALQGPASTLAQRLFQQLLAS